MRDVHVVGSILFSVANYLAECPMVVASAASELSPDKQIQIVATPNGISKNFNCHISRRIFHPFRSKT